MKRTLAALVAVTVASGMAVASPAVAAPQQPETPQLASQPTGNMPAGMVAAMQRDLGLSGTALRGRMAVEAAAAAQERQLRTSLGSTFAGAWLTPDGSGLIVGVTSAARAAEVRAAGAIPQVVTRSAADLDTLKSKLDTHARVASTAIHAWYVDPTTNSVVVEATGQAAANSFIAASGATEVKVVLSDDAHAYQPLGDIRGGDEYQEPVTGGYVLCSIGFSVSGGFATAGHCGGAGQATSEGGVAQGTVAASTFPGNDWAWVQSNPNWYSRPLVNNYSGGTVSVAGSNEAAIGSSVCRSGRTTGWHCGTIQSKNVTVNYSQGAVYGLTNTTACAEGGDSGGSWISGDQAQGVTSGGSGNCTSGGNTLFQPINPLLSHFNLQLVTSGNTSGLTSNFAGRCIDVPNGIPADGTQLRTWDCNGSAAQAWTFGNDGTLRSRGMCMDVAWGSTADGAVVQLANCSGNPAQQWVLSAAGDLVNPQANKCLDITAWNAANGGLLETWTCTGGSNQKWYRS